MWEETKTILSEAAESTIGFKNVEQVRKFCYLGGLITADARCNGEIKRRIAENASGKRSIHENEGATERTKTKSEEKNDQDSDMECDSIWIRVMNHEKNGLTVIC
jgi:hypothetical protein